MKKIFLSLGLIFLSGSIEAANDQYGNARRELPRSSFTTTSDLNVVIASAPVAVEGGGSLFVRSVSFSGTISSTITFYDANLFSSDISTVAQFRYTQPETGGSPLTNRAEFTFDTYFSSAIMYNKQGLAPAFIKWDYTTPPTISGDTRK